MLRLPQEILVTSTGILGSLVQTHRRFSARFCVPLLMHIISLYVVMSGENNLEALFSLF